MPDALTVRIDGVPVRVPAGITVLAALDRAGVRVCRTSVTGEPRGALCGMGICQECRVTIDGHPHERACMTACRDGMEVVTGD